MFADICTGLISILTPETIGAVALGIFTGLMFGAIPGISGIMAISILLPLTFYVSPLVGIPMLLGIYKASMFGGSITAVLLNTPGAPPAVCTAMDGYPLTKQGKAGKGLNAALVGSVFGDTFSNILLICVAAPLSYLTLKVGPVEQCSLILLALTVVGSISGSSILKGILCAGVGILLATVGVSGTTGAMRFTFENENLMSGIALIPMVIGLLCLPEVIHQACSGIRKTFEQQFDLSGENGRLSWQEIKSRIPVLLRSSLIGSVIGAMPGLGASPAAYMAYSEAQRTSKHPEQFGKGAIEGVMAPEAANNAVTGSAMIPLLTLGIPGDDVTRRAHGRVPHPGHHPRTQHFLREHHRSLRHLRLAHYVRHPALRHRQARFQGMGPHHAAPEAHHLLDRDHLRLCRHLLHQPEPVRHPLPHPVRHPRLRDAPVPVPGRANDHRLHPRASAGVRL